MEVKIVYPNKGITGKGRILNINKFRDQELTLITGVNREHQSYFDNSGRYHGGNGTYTEHGQYNGTKMIMKFSLYDNKKYIINLGNNEYYLPKTLEFEIYQNIKDAYGVEKLSAEIYEAVCQLEGQKTDIVFAVVVDMVRIGEVDDYIPANIFYTIPYQINGKRCFSGIESIYLLKRNN